MTHVPPLELFRKPEPKKPVLKRQMEKAARLQAFARNFIDLDANETPPEYHPAGVLLRVGKGWFDLNGFWCVERSHGVVLVSRSAPRRVHAAMTPNQRKSLELAQRAYRRLLCRLLGRTKPHGGAYRGAKT